MPRSITYRSEAVEYKGKSGIAIVKYLQDDSGERELERASGGVWIWLDGDTDAVLSRLASAAEQATAFAVACESKHAEIIRASEKPYLDILTEKAPKSAPKKAPKAPTPPPAPISPAVAANRAIAEMAAPKVIADAPAPAHTPERAKVIAKAREDRAKLATNGVGKVGATVRDTGKPAAPKLSPEEEAEANWLRLLGA